MTNLKALTLALLIGAILGGTSAYVALYYQEIQVVYLESEPQPQAQVVEEVLRPTIPSRSYGASQGENRPSPDASIERTTTTFMPRIDTQAQCLLRGLLVETNGTMSSSQDLHWTATFGPQTLRGYTSTDAFGRFEIPLKGGIQTGEIGSLKIILGKLSRGLQLDPPVAQIANVTLPLSLPRGEYFLGDVSWRQLPLIARGTIVDQAGAPMPRVDVEFSLYDTQKEVMNFWKVKTDKEGRFELRYDTDAKNVSFKVKKFSYLEIQRDGAVGQDDWHITLKKSARLSGVVTKSDGKLKMILVTADGAKHENPTTRQGKSGISFRFSEVAPGWAHLTISSSFGIVGEERIKLLPGNNSTPRNYDGSP
ncbi:MAG: hypothetical protein ACI97A_000652 [Planctomycetota bacterium]|jgi:hypothetical protein